MHHEATPHMYAIRVRYRCHFVFVDGLELARTNSNRMHLIKIKAFLEREQMTSKGQKVDCRIDVLCNLTIGGLASQMLDYEEMVNFPKMDVEARDET